MNSFVRVLAGALVAGVLTTSCGGNPNFLDDLDSDLKFYEETAVFVNPGGAEIRRGEQATALVTTRHKDGVGEISGQPQLTVVDPGIPGVVVNVSLPSFLPVPTRRSCVGNELPVGANPSRYYCYDWNLHVNAGEAATRVGRLTLSAQWTGKGGIIERLGYFDVNLVLPGEPAPPPVPDFQLAVGTATGGVYATRATLPVSITRVGGFAEAVTTFEFDALGSGIAGSFVADPTSVDRRNLQLEIPARYAGGGRVDLRVTATAAGGLRKVLDFAQFIEPMFRVRVEPAAATLTTISPVEVDVSLEPGDNFRTTSLGPVELSISPSTPLPPGVTATFIDDAMPVSPVLPVVKVWRKLRLVTDGRPPGVQGPLTIRGTARGVPPDVYGTQPFVETTLDLTAVEGLFWQFVGNNLTHGTTEAEAIGIAMQSDNRPAVAWLEGTNPKRVYLRRFDGTTFAPSPPRVTASIVPGLTVPGGIDEASFAMGAADVAQVAFTYERGGYLALGSVGTGAAAAWSIGAPTFIGDPAIDASPRARSPRIATGPGGAVVISYIRAAGVAATAGELHVVRTFGGAGLIPLPSASPGGALNTGGGSAIRNATALALRSDGNPWVAWIEQPSSGTPARLWLRGFDGIAWGAAIEVPTPGTPVGASVQLVVEPSGTVAVSWLEGSPAQLKVMRHDPSSGSFTALGNTSNGQGSLNVAVDSPALDVHLARHADGRLLATWTEGGAYPAVWIKRLDADGAWRVVGTTVSQAERWSKTPRIVSDSNNRLYVTWAQYTAGHNPATPRAYAEIEVAQWIFP